MKILVNQPGGIGDIFYLQKAVRCLATDYKATEIIWPVMDSLFPTTQRILYSGIQYIKLSEFINTDFDLQLDFHTADQKYPGSVMSAKYKYASSLSLSGDIHDIDWSNFFNLDNESNFSIERKRSILYEKVYSNDIKGIDFILVNRNFNSPPNVIKCPHMSDDILAELDKEKGYKDISHIEMEVNENYDLLDWAHLCQFSKHVYTVETGLLFLLYKLNIPQVTVFSKWNPPHYNHVNHIFNEDICYWPDEFMCSEACQWEFKC